MVLQFSVIPYLQDMDRRGIVMIMMFAYTMSMVNAQNRILPHLDGDMLKRALVDDYKPGFVELYTDARIKMYREIYNTSDSVECLYSGHKVYLPPFVSAPIQYLYNNENPNGINAEHIYPRSKGANEENGNAFSDLHNLAPSRIAVNSARSNFAFTEITDTETDLWFYRDQTQTNLENIPLDKLGKYAEADIIDSFFEGFFEPREEVKGDVARSIFYFYTMYQEEALEADPEFFENMREVLCQWHKMDPADSIEYQRNLLKAKYQQGKSNPFILDCSLANRLYCTDISSECVDLITAVNEPFRLQKPFKPKVRVIPNPNTGKFIMDITDTPPGPYHLKVFDVEGRLIYSMRERLDFYNTVNIWNNRPGIYFLHLVNEQSGKKYSGSFQITG